MHKHTNKANRLRQLIANNVSNMIIIFVNFISIAKKYCYFQTESDWLLKGFVNHCDLPQPISSNKKVQHECSVNRERNVPNVSNDQSWIVTQTQKFNSQQNDVNLSL